MVWTMVFLVFHCALKKRGALPSLGSVFGPGHDPGNFAMWHPMQRLSSEERKQQEEAAKVAGTKEILQMGSLKEEIQQGSWFKFCSWLKIVTNNCGFQGNSGWLIWWKKWDVLVDFPIGKTAIFRYRLVNPPRNLLGMFSHKFIQAMLSKPKLQQKIKLFRH